MEHPRDTIVIPSRPAGFSEVFEKQKRWDNLRIDKLRIGEVKYIAVYQTKPISAITHYAEIGSLVEAEKKGRYAATFSAGPISIVPIPFTSSDVCAIQGPRYTWLKKVLSARRLDEAF